MKRILYLLPFFLWMCSSDNNEGTNNLSISLTPSVTTAVIGQQFTIMLTSNQAMKFIEMSTDNFVTSSGIGSDLGSSKQLYFNFDTLGEKTISIKVKNYNEDERIETVVVSITRGNAIKINRVQVVSFSNINNTWDTEFSGSDPNRLADVFFGVFKSQLRYFYTDEYSNSQWYLSGVKENQGDLTWDLTSENLYITPTSSFSFGLADDDGGGLVDDLMLGPPEVRTFNFSDYLITKPSTITYTYPSINLEFILTVDWP